MVRITKQEAITLRKHFPDVHITILNKQSSHKKYWVEEAIAIMAFLKQLRNGELQDCVLAKFHRPTLFNRQKRVMR